MMSLRILTLTSAFAATLLLGGCGDSVNNAPPASAMTPHAPTAPPKMPTTTEEKIQAINKAPLSDEEKKAAIDRVNSGKL